MRTSQHIEGETIWKNLVTDIEKYLSLQIYIWVNYTSSAGSFFQNKSTQYIFHKPEKRKPHFHYIDYTLDGNQLKTACVSLQSWWASYISDRTVLSSGIRQSICPQWRTEDLWWLCPGSERGCHECLRTTEEKSQSVFIWIQCKGMNIILQVSPPPPHLHTCWRPPGSWRGGWCGTRLRCRFLPACLGPAGRCPGLSHSCSSSAWRSSPGPLCSQHTHICNRFPPGVISPGVSHTSGRRGHYFLSSMSRPSCRHDWRPMVISVSMSAIFFCISWFLASGTPNWILDQRGTSHRSVSGLNSNTTRGQVVLVCLLTCRVCTDELRGSRTLQHPAPPMRFHTGRCSSSRKVPASNRRRSAISKCTLL